MDILKNIRIGVLGGGISSEREISLESARQAHNAFKRNGINSFFLDIRSAEEAAVKQLMEVNDIDLAFIALHGEFGEDGKIQAILDKFDISYTGSGPLASYLAMDKIVSKEIFIKRNIPTAGFIVYEKKEYTPQSLAHLAKTINFPIVVKPYFAGSSVGVFVVRKPGDFKEAVESAFAVQSKLILEDYIEGRELTVGILEETALSVVEIKPKNDYFDFKTKYSDGLAQFIAPADLGSMLYGEIQAIALAAHRALGCRFFSRVDIRLSTANIAYVLEVNSIPGLTSHSLLPLSAKCCGISFDDLILKMAHLALNEKKQIQKTGKD